MFLDAEGLDLSGGFQQLLWVLLKKVVEFVLALYILFVLLKLSEVWGKGAPILLVAD